ncbi:MAG TPA: hypothetical protein VFC51_12315 [Chloroflexota bacterium]|nr:hypothetical protein [Chloroflexota bacterium]
MPSKSCELIILTVRPFATRFEDRRKQRSGPLIARLGGSERQAFGFVFVSGDAATLAVNVRELHGCL